MTSFFLQISLAYLNIDIHHPIPLVLKKSSNGAEQHDARIVNENVHLKSTDKQPSSSASASKIPTMTTYRAIGLVSVANEGNQVFAGDDVGLTEGRYATRCLDLLHKSLQALHAARTQHDLSSGLSQPLQRDNSLKPLFF